MQSLGDIVYVKIWLLLCTLYYCFGLVTLWASDFSSYLMELIIPILYLGLMRIGIKWFLTNAFFLFLIYEVVSALHSIDKAYYLNSSSYVEPTLPSWHKLHLVMMFYPFYMLVNSFTLSIQQYRVLLMRADNFTWNNFKLFITNTVENSMPPTLNSIT